MARNRVVADLADVLAKVLLIGEIDRAKKTIGDGALTSEQRKELEALTCSELINEANMCAAAVNLWQHVEAAEYMQRAIKDEEKKRRGLGDLPELLQ